MPSAPVQLAGSDAGVVAPPLSEPTALGGERLAQQRASAAPAGNGQRRSRDQVRRSRAWLVPALLAVALIASGEPLALGPAALALSACVAVAAAGPGPRRSVVGLLPLGFLVLCTFAMVWGLGTTALGVDPWGSRATAVVGVSVLIVVTGAVALARPGRVHLWGADAVPLGGFLVLMGVGALTLATQPLQVWSRVMGSGTDFARHLYHVKEVMDLGAMPFGQIGYPRGLHAPVAWLGTALGLEPTMDSLWRALATLVWVMLCLALVGVTGAASRLAGRLSGSGAPPAAAAVVAAAAFLQTAWFDTFIAFGSVMNVLVAVVLLSILLVGLQPRVFGSTLGTLTAASALAVTANAWQLLLPLTGIATIPWIVQWARRGWRRPADAAVWVVAAAVALNGLADQRSRDVGRLVSGATVSDLFRPDWWWWAALVVALAALGAAYHLGLRTWALSVAGLVAASAATVAALLRMTGSSWELMLYYPVKALWTAIVVLIPLVAAGFTSGAVVAWRRSRAGHPGARAVARGALVLGLGVLLVGVIGRGAAFSPHVVKIVRGEVGYPNWSLAVVEELSQRPDLDLSGDAIAFGVVPSAPAGAVRSGFVGMVDYMVMESLRFAGADETTFNDPIKAAINTRDMTGICAYLDQHPDAVRITGPNPAAGPGWIIDSGCPASIVQSDRWVSVDYDPSWVQASPWEVGFGPFPTVAEVRGADPVA